MPTGVAIRDPRGQLFDAAERVLLRDGASALTSRSVTAEAGVAKGVLHRHFADFDAFLAELTLDRVTRVAALAAALREAAGTGTVGGNLAAALPAGAHPGGARADSPGHRAGRAARQAARRHRVPPPARLGVHGARRRVPRRRAGPGRVAAGADIGTLAPTLIGAAHLLFADTDNPPPDASGVARVVATVLAGVTA